LEGVKVDGRPWNKKAPAPRLPNEVLTQTGERYTSACAQLLGVA
jgi:phosphoribosylaminoimidazole-succinocarboxamide synthase